MTPVQLLTFLESTSGYTGRVEDVARMMRAQGLYPAGKRFANRQVSIDEALLFAWVLFTGTTRVNLAASLSVVLAVNPGNGRNFMADLCDIFSDPAKLVTIDCVKLPDITMGFFSQIVFIDGSTLDYGKAGHPQRVTVLSGDYLREIREQLIDKKNSAAALERETPPFKN